MSAWAYWLMHDKLTTLNIHLIIIIIIIIITFITTYVNISSAPNTRDVNKDTFRNTRLRPRTWPSLPRPRTWASWSRPRSIGIYMLPRCQGQGQRRCFLKDFPRTSVDSNVSSFITLFRPKIYELTRSTLPYYIVIHSFNPTFQNAPWWWSSSMTLALQSFQTSCCPHLAYTESLIPWSFIPISESCAAQELLRVIVIGRNTKRTVKEPNL